MTVVDILIYIAKHKGEFRNLKRYSPLQVLRLADCGPARVIITV